MFFARTLGQGACNPFQTDASATDYCGGANYQDQAAAGYTTPADGQPSGSYGPPAPGTDAYNTMQPASTGFSPSTPGAASQGSYCPPGYQYYQGGCYNPVDLQQMQQGLLRLVGGALVPNAPGAKPSGVAPVAPMVPWYKNPLYIALGIGGLALVGGGVYALTR